MDDTQNQKTREFMTEQAYEIIISQAPQNILNILEEAEVLKKYLRETLNEGIRTGMKIAEWERTR